MHHRGWRDRRGAQCRGQPKQQTGSGRDAGGKREHAPVDAKRHVERSIRSAEKRHERTARHVCQPRPQQRARHGQQHAFGHEFGDQSPARGAKRLPHGRVALARAGSRQQEVREVGARDEQHKTCHREQHPERRFVFAAHRRHARVRGFHREAILEIGGRRVGTIRFRQRLAKHGRRHVLQVRRRAFHRPARIQPADHRQPPRPCDRGPSLAVRGEHRIRAHGHRDIEAIGGLHTGEPLRRDRADRKAPAIQRQRPADGAGVTGNLALPEGVIQDDAGFAAVARISIRREPRSQLRRHAQHAQEVRRDVQAGGVTHLAAFTQVELPRAETRDRGKRVLLPRHLFELRERENLVAARRPAGPLKSGRPRHDREFFGMRHRNRPQAHRVQQLEHRRVRADAERQREDGNERKAGVQPQPARGVAHIAHQCVHGS